MNKFLYYKGTSPDRPKEKIASNICNRLRNILDLPEIIEIEFVQLGHSTYGETIVDFRYPNRIRINLDLTLTEIVIPIVHESLHLEQIKQHRLTNNRFGDIVWENKVHKLKSNISYKEYLALPWEEDVIHKQQKILSILFDMV